jgi:hypothetical protein
MNNEIKEHLSEGQTQVYSDGSIDHQYGVNTGAPYLNNPPKQLLDIIAQFYNSSKSDSQVLSILVGMGVPQQLALSGISAYKAALGMYNENNNKQKNHNKMNFTLTQLYENVMKSVEVLNAMKSDGSRISYSASTALNVLENALGMFPHSFYAEYMANNTDANVAVSENTNIDYQNDKYALVKLGEFRSNANSIPVFVGKTMGIIIETNNSESSLIEKSKRLLNELNVIQKSSADSVYKIIELTPAKINEISNFINYQKSSEDTTINEDFVNPNLKFKIAKTLHRNLTQYDWLQPVRELRTYIDDMYNNTKWSFRISEAIERNQSVKGQLTESLINDLNNTLKESENVKGNFSKLASKYPWSSDVKSILNEMAIEDKKAFSNNAGTIKSVLSPIIENENGLNFFLHGKTYSLKNGQITESVVNDQRFFSVLEGLRLFKHINNSLVAFGQNDKSLEYNLTEGTLTLGNTNLSDLNPTKIKESLLATNFFGYKNTANADVVAKFFESVELLYEMDNFTDITSNEFLALYLTVIAVEEGVWINKVNTSMKINEMKFIPSATEAVKSIKEFINYDVTSILSEKLIEEGNAEAKIIKTRNELSERISFLEEKKIKVSEAIAKIGKSEELSEALNLINAEISKFEKELQETYSIVEKKTKDQYLDQGFVEATIENPVSGFKANTMVYVNAEEYSSLGDKDMLTFIDPKNEKSYIAKKKDLKVKL